MKAPADTWIDEIAVERAINREEVGRRLTHAERVEVARYLAAHGKNAGFLCNLLDVSATTARAIYQEATR